MKSKDRFLLFLDYTTTSVRSVTRGGLFQVNDVAYTLFREIEKATRQSLTGVLACGAEDQKDKLLGLACSNVNVQRC